MGARALRELRDRHLGHDVWVLAAGASMDWVAPDFFEGKITVGVNEVYRKYRTTYLVRKEVLGAQAALDSGIPVIISERDCGSYEAGRVEDLPEAAALRGDYWVFPHAHNYMTQVDLSVLGSDKIVVSYSTITSAMHVAAYLGASNILLCGHDCGFLDGRALMAEYPAHDDLTWYREWLGKIEPQTLLVRDALCAYYDVQIHALNPFVNFGLEGHQYER